MAGIFDRASEKGDVAISSQILKAYSNFLTKGFVSHERQ